uniref:Clathrin light chain n=1 Tax=Euplotes harpa TaxID=151035 RepID=A0A7S3NB86_9SPIT|mmetsp:Transcript_32311/g.36818  ORF Transcript_32311/g.36818 Transcript_32311/m.36818 type:complete len:217 (+) Transcript_32311:52-702(+)
MDNDFGFGDDSDHGNDGVHIEQEDEYAYGSQANKNNFDYNDEEEAHAQRFDDGDENQQTFWNQEFSGQNSNAPGGQVVVAKQDKPKVGQAFEAPLTPEEEARVSEVQLELKARMQRLVEKEANEESEKRAAKKELKKWYEDKERDRVAKSKQNKEEEWAFLQQRDDHKRSKNKWEKIIDNVEINPSKYLGTKDVTRMRQSMLARKADIKAQGPSDE